MLFFEDYSNIALDTGRDRRRSMSSVEPIESMDDLLPVVEIETPTRRKHTGTTSPYTLAQNSSDTILEDTPDIDEPGLLFRTFSCQSTEESAQNLRARDFMDVDMPIPSPPSNDDAYFWHRVGVHYRRTESGSPFLSTSNSLLWVVHKAIKQNQEQDLASHLVNINIMVLDPTIIKSTTDIFVGRSMYRECKHRGLIRQAHLRYQSACEYLVWAEIHKDSVLKLISFKDLQSLADRSLPVNAILRLDDMASFDTVSKIREYFSGNPVVLNFAVYLGFAKLLLFFGITPASGAKFIHAGAYALMFGWVIQVDTDASIYEAFAIWVVHFFKKHNTDTHVDIDQAREAFFEGVKAGATDGKRFIKK
jgi:hypothetical protein